MPSANPSIWRDRRPHASVFVVPDLRAFYWHFAREGRARGLSVLVRHAMTLPMNALLAQALVTVTHEYAQRGAGSVSLPTLAVWSNVLRPVGDGIDLRELPAAARLSKRAVRAAVGAALKEGWLVREGNAVRPSPSGEHARERWLSLDADVEASFAGDSATPLREVVRQFFLEWPHYPTGYGPADHSITGGIYVSGGSKTDPKVPTHGVDWAPVPRHDVEGSSVAGLALSALLSEAFVAFAADFEEQGIGALHLAASVLRLLPDDGVPVSDIAMLRRLKGDGKSVLERHRYIEIWRDTGKPNVPLAVPTARGRNTRDKLRRDRQTGRGSLAAHIRRRCRRCVFGPRSSPSISTDRCPTL